MPPIFFQNKESYLFFVLFCSSSTTMSAISDFCTFLFLIFDAPNLNIFGILSMLLFINFLQNSEPKAFDPSSRPTFARLDARPLTDCLVFFHLALIFLSAGAAWLIKILLLFRLAPMVLSRLAFMFIGSYFLLILSHLEVKNLPSGKFTITGYALFLKMIVCFIIFCNYYVEHLCLVFF